MAVELSAVLISQLQSQCLAIADAGDALFPAADPAIKQHVELAWQQAYSSAPGPTDDLARSTLELVGRELLWNAAVCSSDVGRSIQPADNFPTVLGTHRGFRYSRMASLRAAPSLSSGDDSGPFGSSQQ